MTKNYYINGNTVRELDSPVRRGRKTREEIEEAREELNEILEQEDE